MEMMESIATTAENGTMMEKSSHFITFSYAFISFLTLLSSVIAIFGKLNVNLYLGNGPYLGI